MRETDIALDPLTILGGVVMLMEVEKDDSLRRSISMALFTVCLAPSGYNGREQYKKQRINMQTGRNTRSDQKPSGLAIKTKLQRIPIWHLISFTVLLF